MKPQTSIIITTKNAAATLKVLLESVVHQSEAPREIIVVDNASSDNTIEIAKDYTAHVFRHGPERSAQRNFGAKKAEGNYLLFLDADMELSRNVVKEGESTLNSTHVGALYIPEIIAGDSWWAKVRTFERSFYNGTVIDAVRFVRRDVFDKTGGFDETLTGPEDWDFDRRVMSVTKTRIMRSSLYHHEESVSLRSYIAKKMYYVSDFSVYRAKWGSGDPIIGKQLGARYRFFGVFFEEGKWKRLVKNPLLTIAMYGVRLIVGISFLYASFRRFLRASRS